MNFLFILTLYINSVLSVLYQNYKDLNGDKKMKNKLFNFKEHLKLNILIIILTAATVLVLTGHTSHILAYSGYLALLGCVMMHLLMHRGHGKH